MSLRRAATTVAACILGATLTVANTLPAHARTVGHIDVGTIQGEYFVAAKDYDGYFRASHPDDCVKVQRKAAGVWRDNVSSGNGYNCSDTANLSWWIYDNTLAANTEAIQLVVISGPHEGSRKVLCTSRADCQVM